ncbi:MAG: response regulator [Candidatus Heimdallarchaeota archaeon]
MRVRVLLVDDQESFRFLGKEFLEELEPSFEIRLASSGAEALEILANEDFAAVVSDNQMPLMNGLGLLSRLRKAGSTIPFIMLSGSPQRAGVLPAFTRGADYYLEKGYNFTKLYTELIHMIWGAINHRRTRQASQKDQTMLQSLIEAARDGMATLLSSCEEILRMEKDDTSYGEVAANFEAQTASWNELVAFVDELSVLSEELVEKIRQFTDCMPEILSGA